MKFMHNEVHDVLRIYTRVSFCNPCAVKTDCIVSWNWLTYASVDEDGDEYLQG